MKKFIISGKVEKLKSEKGNQPFTTSYFLLSTFYLLLTTLSTCQLFNLLTKRKGGMVKKKINFLPLTTYHLLLTIIVFAFDPVAPNLEANLSSRQIGIVFEWENYATKVFDKNFRTGNYFLRYRKYSFPYLFGIKAGLENVFEPENIFLYTIGLSFNYLFLENTIITPAILTGMEVKVARNFQNDKTSVLKAHLTFSKEILKTMPYFGPVAIYSYIGEGRHAFRINFRVGWKFYSYRGVSYGIDFTVGHLGGWGIYFNNSW